MHSLLVRVSGTALKAGRCVEKMISLAVEGVGEGAQVGFVAETQIPAGSHLARLQS